MKNNDWKSLEDLKDDKIYEEADKIKSLFIVKFLNLLIGASNNKSQRNLFFKRNFLEFSNFLFFCLVPGPIVQKLLEHCQRVTKNSRDFLENNPGKRLPSDYSKYPGNALPINQAHIFR